MHSICLKDAVYTHSIALCKCFLDGGGLTNHMVQLHTLWLRQMYKSGEEMEAISEDFVKQFILNTDSVPAETVLIHTESLKRITKQIQRNETFCFKTDHGEFGWCATCQVELALTLGKII